MGELAGQAVEGTLYFAPHAEFERVTGSNLPAKERAAIFGDLCRLNALYMIARAGSGHIGSSFSSLDIVSWLLLEEIEGADVYFSSKGHDAPGYYAALIGLGRLDFELIHKLRQIDGLPGHPDIGTPGMATNSGSLGMGVSKAKGMILANRLTHRNGRIFVMTGDGELQEGQFWESLISAANFGLHEITVIVDHNKLQSDTFVKNVSDLGDLEAKCKAFGWRVERCDGHDLSAFAEALASIEGDRRPKIVIADTVKGKGVSFMEHTSLDSDVAMYRFHSGAPDASLYRAAAQEIMTRLNKKFSDSGMAPMELETIERPQPSALPATAQRLIGAYTQALLKQAERRANLVALDADLILDTGLIPFREKYPNRFFECGIAEQDMVSMAGGMALKGLLPIVHSFACFLSARPNEQIYNNATELTKIVYVGSLAGVVPGGPGHSHQAVRDISALAAIPKMTIVEPSCEAEVESLLEWCIDEAPGSSYIRLISLPWDVSYSLPSNYKPKYGEGVVLTEGNDVVIIAYGPVMLSSAVRAARMVTETAKLSVKVINLPWLNVVSPSWMKRTVQNCRHVFSIDNHYVIGGQGDAIGRTLAGLGASIPYTCIGLYDVPPSGTNQQVLERVRLDAVSVAQTITYALSST
ncbi:transketolase [Bradyrhizobium shewense]|uniref:Transketolase n=1 Tax=Bradyrhizobium shewense TaxID=1761772 RepID=A0A1C3WR93_9BRAD|nr:transketolase C-terminal domain-containing protein [Bradyrhizobium shewense]SCB42547.1 transketolase [Bradyrhizobium shewense]